MMRAGLTGGIACGKSLVAGFFREAGVPVVDDDVAARDAVAPGTDALAAIVREFGAGVLLADGSLDRPALGRIVFADDRLRRRLMEITFPAIGRLIGERIAAVESAGGPVVVYESALLVENGQAGLWRPLVVVTTTPESQVRRLMERNGLTEAEATDRIRSQMPVADKVALANFAIDNSGTVERTRARFDEAWSEMRRAAGIR